VTADGLLLCDDLLLSSKVTATARAHGRTVMVVRDAMKLIERVIADRPAGVILDLHALSLDIAAVMTALRAVGPVRVVAFGSHVDVERLKAARAAGCNLVLPRSAFVERLEAELPEWLS